MHFLNYQHLLYFRTVATEGSISKAAKKLRLGQPAVSIQIRQLEEALGRELFERKNRSLVLTEAGRAALEYANQIFHLGDEMQEVLKDKSFSRRLHLQIGILDSLPKKLIQWLVESVRKSEDCMITVLEGEGEFLFRELMAHRIDLVASNFPPALAGGRSFQSRLLSSVPVTLWGTRKHRHLKRNFPSSLNGQPFILPTHHSKLRHDLDHYFKVNGLSVRLVIETQDTSVQKMLGKAGMGLVPLPDFAGQELRKQGEWEKLGTLEGVHEDIWLVKSPRQIENPLAFKLYERFRLKTR